MLRRIMGSVLVAMAVSACTTAQDRLKPGQTFRDCPECPQLVVIPAGSFMMGSPGGWIYDNERPRHRVTIPRAFALGKFEVTFAEWDACTQAGECSHRPKDEGWGRGDRPVINVSWDDAHEYVRWLARKTGRSYRLPSEAEWEYAARAGTTTARYWSESSDEACDNANVADQTLNQVLGWRGHNCRDGYVYTAPAGSFRANGFGLHDVLGNVWEWVEDCWNDGYDGAPSDGSAWTTGSCSNRMSRGGSWHSVPELLRAAGRNGNGNRNDVLGFRIARALMRLGYRSGEPYQIDGVWYRPIICPAALDFSDGICGGFRTRP